jgi:uncharacterized membrane protein YfcA
MENSFQAFFNKNEKIIGIVAAVLGVLMFVSLLEILRSNIKGTSHIFIQPTFTAINGLLWTVYAYGKKDWFLFAPNVLALILGTITAISVFV